MNNRISKSPAPHGRALKAMDAETEQALPARNGYQIRLSRGQDEFGQKADQLVARMYQARGLLQEQPSSHIALSPCEDAAQTPRSTITVVACKAEQVVATLTLSFDGNNGLLADALYRDIIDQARKRGGRACEITRLAIAPEHDARDLLVSMLQYLYIVARLIYRISDVFIEVHPRHASFYIRKLGYRRAGPERICPRVDAPAVLLHLHERELEAMLDDSAGRHERQLSRISSPLYEQFETRSELERMGEHMRELLFGGAPLRTNA